MTAAKESRNGPVAKILIGEDGQVMGVEKARTGETVALCDAPRLADKPLDLKCLCGMTTIELMAIQSNDATGIIIHIPPCYYIEL